MHFNLIASLILFSSYRAATVDVRVLLLHLTFWHDSGRSDGTFVPSLRYNVWRLQR